jgi:4-hydroxy-tetrahydrodipicolinate synthase
VDQVKKRVPVLAGAGSNNTAEAVELTRYAKEAGADGALLITPYYNKPTQEGLYQHFKRIAEEVSMPFILYNVPGRTSVNMLPPTVARLFKDVPDIIGIKEATGDLNQVSQVLELCGPDFQVLSGDDFTVLPLLSVGGCGVISVVSNILPDKMSGLCSAWFAGDVPKARDLHFELAAYSRMMFMETNPIPAKTSLSLMGRLKLELRLPLVPMGPENTEKLRSFLAGKGVI